MMTTMLQLAQSAKAREALAAQQALDDDEEDEQSSEAQSEEPPAYSGKVGGIVPGYTGYVPGASNISGTSHVGFSQSPTKVLSAFF